MHRKLLTSSMTATLALVLAAAPKPALAVDFSANIGYNSEYIFRGIPQKSSSAMGGLYLTAGGFYLGAWGADVPVMLVLGEVLCERGAPTRHVYFPVDGFVSLLTRVDEHPSLEVGMVGREGMLGVSLALGVPCTPLRAIVQGAGAAWRIPEAPYRHELARSPALRKSLGRYVYVLMAQLATSAACVRFHRIEPRLARWLLMTQDRAHADRFHVTHDFLAYMLGVRRVGVTMAAGALQDRGLIQYHRGELTVLDRAGLEASACSCYAADRRVYMAMTG